MSWLARAAAGTRRARLREWGGGAVLRTEEDIDDGGGSRTQSLAMNREDSAEWIDALRGAFGSLGLTERVAEEQLRASPRC